ncbi:MAG: hypothetical protein J5817_11290 [Treponema sp.]|nr:hypothetical protein [Treponema sp.]
MKRLFALAFCLVLLLCSGSAYSESWYENLGYEGDVQVTAGYSRFSASLDNGEYKKTSNNLILGLANHNFWCVTDFFFFGFMENIYLGGNLVADDSSSLTMLFAPAVGFHINYDIDINLAFGPMFGICSFSTGGKEKADFTWDGIGCGADLQIKFFSAHLFSPVLGLSWSHLSGDEVNVEINGDDEDMDMRSSADEFKFYAGVSLNF